MYHFFKAQVDGPSESHINSILTLQNQLDNIKKQVEEDKEKIQNLQFTNEEQQVANIELQNKNSELLIKIKELDFELDKERNLAKDIENEKMKVFEKEEEFFRLKEELETLKKLIDNNEDDLKKSVSNLSSEVVDKETILNTLRQTLNENSQNHDRLLKEANEKLATTTERLNKIIEEKDKKLVQNQEMVDQLNEGIKCLTALKNDEHDDIVNNLKNELSKLKDECKVIVDKKEQDNKVFLEKHIKIENELRQELKCQLENKNQEIKQLQEKCSDLTSSKSSEKDVENLKLELKITTEELKQIKSKNLVYSKEALEEVLKQQIQSTCGQIEDLKNQFDNSVLLKNKQIKNCNITLIQIKEQIVKSKSCLEMNFVNTIKEKDIEIKILSEQLKELTEDIEQLGLLNKNTNIELESALKLVQDKATLIEVLEKKFISLESQQNLNKNELEKKLNLKLKSVNDELVSLKLEKSTIEEKHNHYIKETTNTIKDMDNKLEQNNILIGNLNKSLEELTVLKQNELDAMNKRLLQIEDEREAILNQQKVELAAKDEQINTLFNKLELGLQMKQKQDLNYASLQAELTNEITKNEMATKDLQNKINELEAKITLNYKSFKLELEQSNNEKETAKFEHLNLLEKFKSLENSKLDLEEKLASNEISKQDIENLNEAIKEKLKIINDNQTQIKKLDNLIIQNENKYQVVLKEKEEEIKELLKIGQEKINMEKLSLEEKTKVILDEKDRENSVLHKKIKDLENIKISFEKQLEESKLREQELKQLNEIIQEKTKVIEENCLKIEQLNENLLLTKNEFEIKLQEKEEEINELSKHREEKIKIEKDQMEKQTNIILDEKTKEISNLLEKINTLENIKVDLEKQLEICEIQEKKIIELNKSIEEKRKIIDSNNSKVEELNKMNMLSKEEFNTKLKDMEDSYKEFIKLEKEKLMNEKLKLEKNNQTIMNEKDKEILNLVEKINVLQDKMLNIEKQLEVSKTQEHDIIKLKKTVEEKTKALEENNLKVEHLNGLVTQTKENFDAKLLEKENEINELVKIDKEKLNAEKMEFETHIKIYLDEKDKEIAILKTQLQESVENNQDKTLMLKLESISNELEKEKIRASNLEKIKSDLQETVLQHKTELELLETSKTNKILDMTKTVEEQQILNAKLNEELNQLKPLL